MNIDLTHPEILTIEQLQQHLKNHIESNLPSEKCELIQLFYKYIVPLPQRKFPTNRLGSILAVNQNQHRAEKRPFSSISEDTEKSNKCKLKTSKNDPNHQFGHEKHETDRGIYTIKMSNPKATNTAPIKLKRPIITTNNEELNKKEKLDQTNS